MKRRKVKGNDKITSNCCLVKSERKTTHQCVQHTKMNERRIANREKRLIEQSFESSERRKYFCENRSSNVTWNIGTYLFQKKQTLFIFLDIHVNLKENTILVGSLLVSWLCTDTNDDSIEFRKTRKMTKSQNAEKSLPL